MLLLEAVRSRSGASANHARKDSDKGCPMPGIAGIIIPGAESPRIAPPNNAQPKLGGQLNLNCGFLDLPLASFFD